MDKEEMETKKLEKKKPIQADASARMKGFILQAIAAAGCKYKQFFY